MAGADLPKAVVLLDKYDLMVLEEAIAVAREKHYWSNDEAADLAVVGAKLSTAAQELANAQGGYTPRDIGLDPDV